MRVIIPQKIELVDSNVPADTSPVWDSTTTYSAGDTVIVTGLEENSITKKYESIIDNNVGAYPPDNPDKWKDLGPTERYKCLDNRLGTQTVYANLILSIKTKKVDTLGLFNINGSSVSIKVYNNETNELLYEDSSTTYISQTSGWYDYFFSEYVQKTAILFSIPISLFEIRIDIEFTGDNSACGLIYCGRSFIIGETLFGARVGIIDFSVKEFDNFGQAYLVKRTYSKQAEFDVMVPTNQVSTIQNVLANLRATPCVFDANNIDTNHESLIIYGFYRNFEETFENANISYCTIEIEGLT